MVRDGDTLIVTCDIPENEGRGFPVRTVRHYNWAAVAYGTPMPEKVTSANKR